MSPFSRLCLVFVALAALLQLSRGQETTKQPFLLQKIKDSLAIVHEGIHHAIENSKLGDIITFDAHPTTTTTEMSIETTTGEDDDYELSLRQFIDVPVRCRPGYDFIRGSCRKKVLRWIAHLFFLYSLLFSFLFMLFSLRCSPLTSLSSQRKVIFFLRVSLVFWKSCTSYTYLVSLFLLYRRKF